MLYSNTNLQSEPVPERRPFGPLTASGREAPAVEAETAHIPVLGKTLLFRGELSAEEDVILQGRVEGSIRHARNLIIGTEGSVQGDVYANHVTVEGLVEGDLHCSEAVIVRATAQVRGNIFAPRVGIMEGATFNGRVEMDSTASAARSGESRPPARQLPAAQRTSAPARASAGSAPPPPAPGAPLANADVDQMLSRERASSK